MREIWGKYSSLFNGQSFRERAIIGLCVLAGIYLIWDLTVLGNIRSEKKILEARYDKAVVELDKLAAEKKVLNGVFKNNPNTAKQREVTQLHDRVDGLDAEIEELSAGLVSAEKLPGALREILISRSELQLAGLHALAPEKLSLGEYTADRDQASEREEQFVSLYKHRVVMQVQGKYFAIRDFLADLEKSEWQFYWQELDYSVDEYPYAIAQIEVYTLSLDIGFIGG